MSRATLRYGMARVNFLALKDEISAELTAGKPMRMVHREMEDRLSMSYPTFRRYVVALLKIERKPVHTKTKLVNSSQSELSGSSEPPTNRKDGFRITRRSREDLERLFGKKPS